MSGLAIPDPRLIYTPELYVPGQKPVSPVVLNKQHRLASKLVFALPCLGGVDPMEYVNNYSFARTSPSPLFEPDGINFRTTTNCYLTGPASFPPMDEVTIVARYTGHASEQYGGLVSDKTNTTWASAVGLNFATNLSGLACTLGNRYAYKGSISGGIRDGKTHDIGARAKIGSNVELFLDRAKMTGVTANGAVTGMSKSSSPITVGTTYDAGSIRHPYGVLHYLYVFDTYLSHEDMCEVWHDPYQLYVPAANATLLFLAGGGISIPALLADSGIIRRYTDESPNYPLCLNTDGSIQAYSDVTGKKPLVLDQGQMRVLGAGETLDH